MQRSSRHPATLIHRIRSFAAVGLPENLVREVAKVQYRLKTKYPDVQLTPEEQLHMTLFFLGRQAEPEILRLAEKMGKEMSFPAISLQFDKLNYIYKKGEDSIVYLEPKGEVGNLKKLVKLLAPYMEKLDYTAPRRWLPHLTIARVGRIDPISKKRLLFEMANENIPTIGPWIVEVFSFWESILSRTGAFHRRMATVPLAGKAGSEEVKTE